MSDSAADAAVVDDDGGSLETDASLSPPHSHFVDRDHSAASDDNPGTEALPWKTIQHAADVAQPGNRVLIKAGTYREFITIAKEGSALQPIVFEGQRGPGGPGGAWRTIVDPSTDVSVGWVAAPEIGPLVFKKPDVPFEPREMTLDGKRILRIGDSRVFSGAWLDFINRPANAIEANGQPFWTGVEAIFAYDKGITYIRFRNGDDPNGRQLWAVPNGRNPILPLNPAFRVTGAYVVLRHLRIAGAHHGVAIQGGHHNTVEDSSIAHGYCRIGVYMGAHHNVIRRNVLSMEYYGFGDPGAWENDSADPTIRTRRHLYDQIRGDWATSVSGGQNDNNIKINGAGEGNEVADNEIARGMVAIEVEGTIETPVVGTRIHDNYIHGFVTAGILLSIGHTDTRVFGNRIQDATSNVRWHQLGWAGERNRSAYIFRNQFWEPSGIGSHIFCNRQGDDLTTPPILWVYNNSFSGGEAVLDVNNGVGALGAAYLVNNLISSATHVAGVPLDTYVSATLLGAFDYNTLSSSRSAANLAAPWYGPMNQVLTAPFWPIESVPDFAVGIPEGAIDSAVDVQHEFALNGRTVGPLPGPASSRQGSGLDRGALEIR